MSGKPLYDGLWKRALNGMVSRYGQAFHDELAFSGELAFRDEQVLLERALILSDGKAFHDGPLYELSHDETPWEHALMSERTFLDDSWKNVRAFNCGWQP